jgi:uncharacterized protein YjbI with pentapeptide repeats
VRQRLQQRRLLVRIFLGIVAVTGIVFVVWVLPSVLTEHPRIPKSADRQKAITDTRTGLVAMLVAIGAAGGLAFTAGTYRLGQETYRLSREGQITDRLSTAVEQLGDEKIEVRLGGIYSLERLMHDSPADQPNIMETLAAFVRQHAQQSPRPALPARGTPPSATDHPAEDVQAVLTVLGRRHPVDTERSIDLMRTNLTGANLEEANLTGANLPGANLTNAHFFAADLTGAHLDKADLTGANFLQAILTRVSLDGANLTGARLLAANLTGANLNGTNLTDAKPRKANLTRAVLQGADLTRTYLIEANLTGARLDGANLTGARFDGANLTGAYLRGATLTEGSLTDEQLVSAAGKDEIKWVTPSRQTS